jgi:hypothetical protein
MDEHYCRASVKQLKDIASYLVPDVCVLISQDDKAKIPLGVAAVSRTFHCFQSISSPLTVPDHDFPIANKHKIIPSFYLFLASAKQFDEEDPVPRKLACVTRGQLFTSTSAQTHLTDLSNMMKSDCDIQKLTLRNGVAKPVYFFITDGGPDENPRFLKNIHHYCNFFTSNPTIDYISVRVYAPGQSAFNPVERSMAPFSKKLAGVVLPYFKEKSHLSKDKKTVQDMELAHTNFAHAAKELGVFWTDEKHYGNDVLYRYENELPASEEQKPFNWIEAHCSIGQYSLDIKKCHDRACCSEPSTLNKLIPLVAPYDGFIPGNVMRQTGKYAPVIQFLEFPPASNETKKALLKDFSLPSRTVQRSVYVCKLCDKYYPTKGDFMYTNRSDDGFTQARAQKAEAYHWLRTYH